MENASLLAILNGMPALRQRPVPEDGSRHVEERQTLQTPPGRASTPPLPKLGNVESFGFGGAYEGFEAPETDAAWARQATPPRAGAGVPSNRRKSCSHSKAPSSGPTAPAAQRSPRVR